MDHHRSDSITTSSTSSINTNLMSTFDSSLPDSNTIQLHKQTPLPPLSSTAPASVSASSSLLPQTKRLLSPSDLGIDSTLELVLLIIAIVLGVALCLLSYCWYTKRRNHWKEKNLSYRTKSTNDGVHPQKRGIYDLGGNDKGTQRQQNQQQQINNEPNPEDLEKLPKIGSILEGATSYPEISIVSSRAITEKSSMDNQGPDGKGVTDANIHKITENDDNDEDDDDAPSIIASEVSSMWDSTSQKWDNNYFIESERGVQNNAGITTDLDRRRNNTIMGLFTIDSGINDYRETISGMFTTNTQSRTSSAIKNDSRTSTNSTNGNSDIESGLSGSGSGSGSGEKSGSKANEESTRGSC